MLIWPLGIHGRNNSFLTILCTNRAPWYTSEASKHLAKPRNDLRSFDFQRSFETRYLNFEPLFHHWTLAQVFPLSFNSFSLILDVMLTSSPHSDVFILCIPLKAMFLSFFLSFFLLSSSRTHSSPFIHHQYVLWPPLFFVFFFLCVFVVEPLTRLYRL